MCSVIEKYYGQDIENARKEARAEGEAKGETNAILKLVAAGIITAQQGAAQLGISEAEMAKMVAAKQ